MYGEMATEFNNKKNVKICEKLRVSFELNTVLRMTDDGKPFFII